VIVVLMTEGLVAVVGFEDVCASHPQIGGIRELGGKIIGRRFSFLLPYQSISFLYLQM
jgi:hypothetical protein